MEEVWRDIGGYEGVYQISNLGRVKSLHRSILRKNGVKQTFSERILKIKTQKNGYKFINLKCQGKQERTFRLHRLVAEAFIPNPLDLPCINHKDEDKSNNTSDNLEWCTQKYNINYGSHNEKVSSSQGRKVFQFSLVGDFIRSYKSVNEATIESGINNISAACNGKYNQAGGYLWSYEKNAPQYSAHKNSRKIVCMKDSSGDIEFKSLRDAEMKTGIARKKIASDCRTNRNMFYFKYE